MWIGTHELCVWYSLKTSDWWFLYCSHSSPKTCNHEWNSIPFSWRYLNLIYTLIWVYLSYYGHLTFGDNNNVAPYKTMGEGIPLNVLMTTINCVNLESNIFSLTTIISDQNVDHYWRYSSLRSGVPEHLLILNSNSISMISSSRETLSVSPWYSLIGYNLFSSFL